LVGAIRAKADTQRELRGSAVLALQPQHKI